VAGRIVRVIPKTQFDFVDIAANGSMTIPVAMHIDVSEYRSAVLMVRFHSIDIAQANASITVVAMSDGKTQQDPSETFFDLSNPLGSVQVTSSDSGPLFLTDNLVASQKLPGMLGIGIQGAQGGTQGDVQAEISIDLALKE